YYADASHSSQLGVIDLTSVTAVSTVVHDRSDLGRMPAAFVLNVTTHRRLWTFAVETGEEQAAWNQCLQLIIFQNARTGVEVALDKPGSKPGTAAEPALPLDPARRASLLTGAARRKNSLAGQG
ncbi:hypothetical protein TeGR_g11349, partial [Tetraparma gracilis]